MTNDFVFPLVPFEHNGGIVLTDNSNIEYAVKDGRFIFSDFYVDRLDFR